MRTLRYRFFWIGVGFGLLRPFISPAQWVAYNDHAAGSGTHSNATRYHVFANGSPSSGSLRNIRNGAILNASLSLTRTSSGVTDNSSYEPPAPGSPSYNLFNGYVDFGGNPSCSIEVAGSGVVTYTFTGLDLSKRYRFHGSAIRGSPDYTNRWALCEIEGAAAFTSAHSSNVLTAAKVPGSLTAAQAALNTGANHTAATGDFVCWENIQPAASGSFAVTCKKYAGAVPGGSSSGSKGYALTALRLEEISTEESPVAILGQPLNQTVFAGKPAGFSADASGNPIYYQWFKDGYPLAGETNRVLVIASATTNDIGSYSFTVSNRFNSVTSSNALLSIEFPYIVEWGRNDYNQVSVPNGLSNVVMMAAGSWHGLAMQRTGKIFAWGRNVEGQLNVPDIVTNAVTIAGGYQFNMALMPDRTVRCWGDNLWGQCSVPSGLTNVVMIAPGYDHALALRANGTVVGWGRTTYGAANVPAGLTNVFRIYAGGYSSFALRAGGLVTGWGLNDNGQTSVPAGLSNVVALAPGNFHTLALTADGRVVAWGNNGVGQSTVPAGLSNVVAIAVGGGYSGSHSLALKDDGTVVAWGYNNFGQSTLPANLPRASRIGGGEYYTMIMNAQDPSVAGPVLLPSPYAMGVAGGAFHHRLAVRNGPVTFSANGLPPDLMLDAATGLITGVPKKSGSYTVELSVTNAQGCDQRDMTVIIQPSNLIEEPVVDPGSYPVSANQRGTVACREARAVSYDIYLPPAYTTNGPALPILYTMHPGGGGMVGDFQSVCSTLNIIAVGITGFMNGASKDTVFREFYAVTRDIRQRVLFDPTAELAGGFSGGGLASYMFSRFHAQHTAGVLAMGAWLGRQPGETYSTDRVLTNLLVARATGTSDSTANLLLPYDSNYLASCGAVIRDWSFPGGHTTAPAEMKSACLAWLLSRRVPAGPNDQANAKQKADDWRLRMAGGQKEAVARECAEALMRQPRSWMAHHAQDVMDDLMKDFDSFRTIPLDGLAQGDFASDFFYYLARGAANAGDQARYRSSLKALTGVSDTCGDRAGDIRSLLTEWGYPAPVLKGLAGLRLQVSKDAPGLDYSARNRSDLSSGSWLDVTNGAISTGGTWTLELGTPPSNAFYRVWATPAAATNSPPFPF